MRGPVMLASMGFLVDRDGQSRGLPMQTLIIWKECLVMSVCRDLCFLFHSKILHSRAMSGFCVPTPLDMLFCLVQRKHPISPKAWGVSFLTNHLPHSRSSSALIHLLSKTSGTMFWGKPICHSPLSLLLLKIMITELYVPTALNTINTVVVSPFSLAVPSSQGSPFTPTTWVEEKSQYITSLHE